jgi:hypothetical protein|tara:strand:+ start:299 stop:460 length:162 start_codon:yes stop_codon:yes gene_type:complete
MIRFKISMTLDIDESGNILSIDEEGWEQDMEELVEQIFYDIDDAKISYIKVKK